jgi:hypothetical protein
MNRGSNTARSLYLELTARRLEVREDCEKTVYKAGEGFLESHDDPMLVRNRGSKAVRTVSVPC